MRQCRALLSGQGTSIVDLYWAGCIINISGFDLRQAQAKAERQKPGSCSEVDQRMLLPEAQSLCHVAKEFSRIRRPQFPVQRNSGGEASHDRVGDPFVYRRRPVIESRLQIAVAKGLRECAPYPNPTYCPFKSSPACVDHVSSRANHRMVQHRGVLGAGGT